MPRLPAQSGGEQAEAAPPQRHLDQEEGFGAGMHMVQQRPQARHDRRVPVAIIAAQCLAELADAVIHHHARPAGSDRRHT
jgi:hypothetical protein